MSSIGAPTHAPKALRGRGITIFSLVLLIAVLGLAVLYAVKHRGPVLPPLGEGNWETVKREDFPVVIKEKGSLKPAKVISIMVTRDGKVGWVVPDGSRVKKGDKVLALDTDDLQKEIAKIEDDVMVAQRNLDTQVQTLDLETKRLDTDLLAVRDALDLAKLKESDLKSMPKDIDKESAASTVKASEARLEAARVDLDLIRPLLDMGFVSRVEYQQKELALNLAEEDLESAHLKAKRILDGATKIQLVQAAQDVSTAQCDYALKEIERESSLDSLKAKVVTAEQGLKWNKAVLAERKRWLEESVRYAPSDGLVVYREYGGRGRPRKVSVGEQINPWITPLELPNYDVMRVRTQIPEESVDRLVARRKLANGAQAPGTKVKVQVNSVAGHDYEAEVVWIDGWARDRNDDKPDTDKKREGLAGVRVFNVEVEILESDPEHLREGFQVGVVFPLEVIPNAISVPAHAVEYRDQHAFLIVGSAENYQLRQVKLGKPMVERVEIVDGLKEGEQVWIKPAPVKPKTLESRGEKDAAPDAGKSGSPDAPAKSARPNRPAKSGPGGGGGGK